VWILLQFVYRLSFGLAAAMAGVSPRQVTSGYFRNHLYVLLGLDVLAAAVASGAAGRFPMWPAVAAALASYAGSVAWLYEKPRAGRALLVAVAVLCLVGGASLRVGGASLRVDNASLRVDDGSLRSVSDADPTAGLWYALDFCSAAMTLGTTLAAMFLGHWYLNSPGMKLAPLERLIGAMAGAVAARAGVCGAGLVCQVLDVGPPDASTTLFLILRWLAGIFGAMALAAMAWRTLKIPNTQSATGILYVAVIVTFIGELCSLLLDTASQYPL